MARVARATASRAGVPHPGALATPSAEDAREDATDHTVAAFVKRFTRSGGEVARPDPGRPPAEWLTAFLRGLEPQVEGVAVAPDVPPELRPRLPEVAAAHAGAGVSMAWGAAADTGSLVLPSTGMRAVQLLPPVHVVWVPAGRVFARLEDALLELGSGTAGDRGTALRPQQVGGHRPHGRDRGARAGTLHRGAQLNAASSTRLQGISRPALRA